MQAPGTDIELDAALDAMGAAVAVYDARGRLVRANAAFRGLLPAMPTAPGTERGRIDDAIMGGFTETEDGRGRCLRRAGDGLLFRVEERPTATGGRVQILSAAPPLETDAGTLAVLGGALQRLGAPMALFDDDLCFVAANEAWHDLFYETGDGPAAGTHTFDITAHIVRRGVMAGVTEETAMPAARQYADLILSCAQNLDVPLADGRWLSCSSNRTELGGYLLVFRDVTAERAATRARQAAVEDAIQTLSAGVALWDGDFRFVLANERYHEIWFPPGLERPQAGEPFRSVVRRVAAAGQMEMPPGITPDVMVDMIVAATAAHGRDFVLNTPRGTVSCSALPSPLRGYLHEFIDITERLAVEAELERQREIAHQTEKLSALGELLAGVAHELNNPLGIAQGYAQMLEGRADLPADATEQAALIAQSAERAARIVRTFLAMARQRPARMERLDPGEVVVTALDVSAHGLRARGAEVLCEIEPDLPEVTGDFDQLAQVVSNLVINADQALQGTDRPGRVTARATARAGAIVISVEDDGPGIPPDALGRVFEPFFTTKDVGQGTGIGLAFCHRIIVAHEGALTAHSDGQGARFEIRLPVAPAEMPAAPESPPPVGGAGRTVLIVDDEPALARLMADTLRAEGYDVVVEANPRAALRRIDGTRYDAVVTDIRMPELDGPALWRAVRTIAPGLERRIGFVTGDALAADTQAFLAATGRPHLEKPVLRDELVRLVASLCTSGDAT